MPKCSTCGKFFKRSRVLKIHNANKHPLKRSLYELTG